MNKPTIIERDGVVYLQLHCPSCESELLFKCRDEERRVHFACAKCGKSMETCVPSLKEAKKMLEK